MNGLFPFKSFNGFDSIAGDAADKIDQDGSPLDVREMLADMQALRGAALTVVLRVIDGVAELEDDMTPTDLIDALTLSALGVDEDEPVDPLVNDLFSANMADAMASLGVPEDLINDVWSNDIETADAAIEAMAEKALESMPDDGDAMDAWVKEFIYGFDAKDMMSTSDEFDSLSAGKSTTKTMNGKKIRYKAVKAVRNGRVVVVNKRVAGQKVKLSSAQKAAMKKLHSKPMSQATLAKRVRSLAKGTRAGIYKNNSSVLKGVRTTNMGKLKDYKPS